LTALNLHPLIDPIWKNEDENVSYTYSLSQQGIAGRLSSPSIVDPGAQLQVTANVSNRSLGSLKYSWSVPEGFQLLSQNGSSALFKTPSNAIPNSYAPLTVMVSDGISSTPLGSLIKFKQNGAQTSYQSAYERALLNRYGQTEFNIKGQLGSTGVVGSLYKHDIPNNVRYFQLLKSPYRDYYPKGTESNSEFKYLGTSSSRYNYLLPADTSASVAQGQALTRTASSPNTTAPKSEPIAKVSSPAPAVAKKLPLALLQAKIG